MITSSDYQALLDTQISAEFAAVIPIMHFMMDEGIKVFTILHMSWDGIQGIGLFGLDWKEDSSDVLKPSCRPIKKYLRSSRKGLRGYRIFPSKRPICSNRIVASNATIRRDTLIRRQLDRIQDYSIYVDNDFKNAFHQARIFLISSARLSIVTP